LVLFIIFFAFSQNSSYSLLDIKELKNNIRLNYTRVHMPDELNIYGDRIKIKPTMGFVGVNFSIGRTYAVSIFNPTE